MVPNEPKTDSKEFDVPGLDQRLTPATRSAASEPADLTIRILHQDAGSGGAALTWSSESVLVYMIADLVAASHGRTAVETPASMAAHFDSSLHALVAAKRIQTAILEFLVFRPSDSIGAAVLIHPPAAAFNQTMAQSALRLSEAGQIILSQEVARRFRDLPGIELRAVPALTTGGTEHSGLSELIWTSAERMASLRNKAPAAPTANLGAPFGATMIVNTPLAGPHGEADNTPARSSVSADGFSTSSKRSTAIDGLAHREGAFEETLAEFEQHQSFITPLKIAGAAIAVVVVVVALVLFHPWSGSNPPLKAQPHETPGLGASVTPEPPAASHPQPPPAVQPVEESHVKPPIVKPVITSKQPSTAKEKLKKPEDTPIQGFEGNSTYDGMTQKDIPRLLQWARSDAGNGNYAKAAQEYRVILQLQPGNADAREGLRKIQVAQEREQ